MFGRLVADTDGSVHLISILPRALSGPNPTNGRLPHNSSRAMVAKVQTSLALDMVVLNSGAWYSGTPMMTSLKLANDG